jgi:hypothetical protein
VVYAFALVTVFAVNVSAQSSRQSSSQPNSLVFRGTVQEVDFSGYSDSGQVSGYSNSGQVSGYSDSGQVSDYSNSGQESGYSDSGQVTQSRYVMAEPATAYFAAYSESSPITELADDDVWDASCGLSDCCCQWRPWFYGQAEALFLERDIRGDEQVVVIDVNRPPGDDVVLRTGDLDFDFESGFRALLGYQLKPCMAVEFVYFGVSDASASATAVGNDNLAVPGDLGLVSLDFFDADIMRVSYSAEMHNFEVNLVGTSPACCHCGGCCGCGGSASLLAGFRYLNLDEVFNINSTDFDTGTSNYNISTRNNLYGFQIGARWKRCWERLGVDFTGKAGIFANDAKQRQFVTDFGGGPAFPQFFLRTPRSASSTNVAFVGDLNLSLCYKLTDVWSVRGGYNLMWIEGVGLAPSQLDFTNTPTSGTQTVDSGGVFWHGVNVGVQACW